ncbi:hypothetical protein MLD38_029520 [Melastoma candidum]|uniref:Uncharacterized protein n=1 Tax=Melastoma candidum TaxID=119954 RepID=A0ACB9N4D9_9MYRT|nr:hypothetical protein MLD38_029520 [Melastoma candidum]
MGFLHKLWDETLAGPAPESGLGKLRKYDSFSGSRSHSSPSDIVPPVTRSITVLKNAPNFTNLTIDPGSVPDSPVGSSGPGTPNTPGTPDGNGKIKKFARKKPSTGSRSVDVMSSLDR